MKKKNFIKSAKHVINLEIKALEKLKKSLSSSFNFAVEQITKCQSKVILCGVGKSGLIAHKIAATLSSVGAPSFYLSASNSSHGDLGSISKKDILIIISYSGQTNELKNIRKKEVCCYNKCKTSVTSSMGIKCTKCNKKVCIPHRHKHYEICNKDKLQNNPIKKTEPNKPNIFKWLKWFKS